MPIFAASPLIDTREDGHAFLADEGFEFLQRVDN
jgi:hypothetical protein